MKLIKARFENFRLLRDLELDFSTDPKRNLTVIRAENETGKTTILTALQWAFYGDEALPGESKAFRLHPIDWKGPSARITVEVDFEASSISRRQGGARQAKRYRVVRTVMETINGVTWKRGDTSLHLYEIIASGAQPIEYPQNRLRAELPTELREIFFTDGDRALSFIEADSTTVKRQRVENAIKSLLGLSVLEDAGKHVRQAAADTNRKVRESGAGAKARETAKRIEVLDNEITESEQQASTAQADRDRCEEQYDRLNRQIETLVARGDRTELIEELRRIRNNKKRDEALQLSLAREQGDLLRSQVLIRQMLGPHVTKAAEILNTLKDKGDIPNQAIPILTDRLTQSTCICGETLDAGTPDGKQRREHIEHLIESSRAADETKKIITVLYYGAQELLEPVAGAGWKDDYAALIDRRNKVDQNLKDHAAKEAELEAKIALIPDVDLQALREQRKVARRHADDAADRTTRAAVKLESARQERKTAEAELQGFLGEESKGQQLGAELTVANDVLGIFDRSLERLKRDELKRVSDLMNEIFLEMIGADVEQGAIIQRAMISPEFDIVVFGPDGRLLNPDRDLNGASRRALTLAFILALTRVSEVEAPNIIDTPLGMMSGYVKSSVLQAAVAHSAQLILLLTRSEISGTEKILDEYAGRVITLTNPMHYPKMLLNEPPSRESKVLRCDCSYDESCSLCARRMDVEAKEAEQRVEAVA